MTLVGGIIGGNPGRYDRPGWWGVNDTFVDSGIVGKRYRGLYDGQLESRVWWGWYPEVPETLY